MSGSVPDATTLLEPSSLVSRHAGGTRRGPGRPSSRFSRDRLNLLGRSCIGTGVDALPAETVQPGVVTHPLDRVFTVTLSAEQAGLFRLAVLMLGGDRERAEDAVAEAVARVYPRWRAGHVADLGPYLRRAVINEVVRLGRRRRLERRDEPHHMLGGRSVSVSALDDQVVTRDRVVRALRCLPGRQRAVVVLRFYEDLDEAEIARLLDVSVGTVKSQLSRALPRLRTLMDEEE
jgi:RNA polymerase sigma factor (sigma-70 family)